MIKLKDILLESDVPDIFVPRRIEDRFERMIKDYIRKGSKGDINISFKNLKKIPEILKGITINGNFYCNDNKLTSLVGAPKIVSGNFTCSDNKLSSLVGAPKKIGGDFYCSNNKLTSLDGCPKYVGKDFYCYKNSLKFTEEQIRAVCYVKGKVVV